MASTGKIATTSVREFLNKNKVYGDQVGKLSLDLDEVLKKENKFLLKDFISDPSTKESFVFEWLITSVRHVPWKLHTDTLLKLIDI